MYLLQYNFINLLILIVCILTERMELGGLFSVFLFVFSFCLPGLEIKLS